MHRHRAWLDVLRASAVIAVVLVHGVYFFLPVLGGLDAIVDALHLVGGMAVDLFFALSGYLVGGLLIRTPAHPGALRTFVGRRLLRTLPGYYVALLLNIGLALLAGISTPALPPFFLFLQNVLYPAPDFFTESWTLSVEEGFYALAVGAIACAGSRLTHRHALLLTGGLLIAAVNLARVYCALHADLDWDHEVKRFAPLRIDAPCYGLVLAAVRGSALPAVQAFRSAVLILCITIAGFTWGGGFVRETVYFSLQPLGFALLVYACGHAVRQPTRDNTLGRIFGATARISFSLYLSHCLAIRASDAFIGPPCVSWMDATLKFSLYLMTSAVLTYAMYRHVESPFLRIRERALPASSARIRR